MNSKQHCERLLSQITPFAERMLREYGEFYPYGGYMRPDGEIVEVGAEDPDSERPKSKDLIFVLRSSFRELAKAGNCIAIAIVFDVAVTLPQSNQKSDAIQVCLEHEDGYSAEVFFPYQIVNGEVVYGETFAQQGGHDIFVND